MSTRKEKRPLQINRSTWWANEKAGLAPRSTGFMMGVKANHHFAPGQPFVDKNSPDYA